MEKLNKSVKAAEKYAKQSPEELKKKSRGLFKLLRQW